MDKKTKLGIVGTGFLGKGLWLNVKNSNRYDISVIRSRRNPEQCGELPPQLITDSNARLIDESDIIIECSGDPVYATPIVREALQAGKPVLTMDVELHVTTGTYLKQFGSYFSEADGDQPGCLAALHKEAVLMGFKPVVYGNMKGFLDLNPTLENMLFYSKKQKISLDQVTSFTDGTKVIAEQVLVANGLGADLAPNGMIGGNREFDGYREGAFELARFAEEHGIVLSDYMMCKKEPSPGRDKFFAGVFIVARHDEAQADYLEYYRMGKGPYYTLEKTVHLCHLEVMKTIDDYLNGIRPLLTNGDKPKYSVAAVAKRDMKPGEVIKRAIGSFDARGEGIAIAKDIEHIPIGLIFNAKVIKPVKSGQTIHFEDLELPESEALQAWARIIKNL